MVCPDVAGQARPGADRFCFVCSGVAVMDRNVEFRPGYKRNGEAGMVSLCAVRCGFVGYGLDRQERLGTARRGQAWLGDARCGRRGPVGSGEAYLVWSVEVRNGRHGKSRFGPLCLGTARNGRLGGSRQVLLF